MDIDKTFGERLATSRKNKKLSQEALARHLGVSKQAVSHWEKGANFPDNQKLPVLASLLNVRVGWLLTGTEKEGTNINTAIAGAGGVLLFSFKEALDIKEAKKNNTDRFSVPAYFDFSEKSFALKIEDLSMSPEYQIGDIVVIDPTITPEPGDHVCAKVHGLDKSIFRVYKSSGADTERYTLSSLNSHWEDIKSSGQIIGVMVQHIKPRRKN